jgi:hypothetical protein
MKYLIVTATIMAAAGPACAQSITLKPLVDLRIRSETVDQAGFAHDADGLTIRLRGGVEAVRGRWSVLVEGQATLAAIGRYDDGLHGASSRPLIADPENIALYRAQLQYRAPGLTVTAGRQRIALDDERFVGAVNFRDNGQTFDALRVEWSPLARLKMDLSYAWSARTIWGIDGNLARQQAVSGDNVFANLSYVTPIGQLTGFAYLVDQDESLVQQFRLSSQTYGVRLAGTRPLAKAVKLSYQLSYARQSDRHRNPNDYRANYYLADVTLDLHGVKLNAGYEVLGAASGKSAGVTLTSFQTPLATGFKFQGWADRFLTTPPNGLRDLYAGLGYGWTKLGPLDALSFQAAWHRFDSDRLSQHYGNEVDLLVTAKRGRSALSLRYADYRADRFATDTRKLWLQFDWAL